MSQVKPEMNRGLFLIGVLMLCITFLSSTPGRALAAPKGKVTTATSGASDMTGGDVHTVTGASAKTLISMLHGKLVTKDSDGRLQPDLAKSWSVGPNWSFIKFILDDRAKFHDGTSVTAEDVKFSFERISRPEMKHAFGGEMRRKIDRVEIVDKNTIVIHNKSPYSAFFDRASEYIGIVPKKYVDKVGDAGYSKNPIGSGPFKFVKYNQDVFFEVEAFTGHHRKVPYIKTVRYTNVQEDATRIAQIKTGEVDMAKLPYGTFWEVEQDPNIRIIFSKMTYLATLAYYDLAFPDEPSPFHDIRVRKAASLAINREVIARKVMHNLLTPWGDMLASYHPGYDPSIKPDPYDIEKAKALLNDAGYPNGFDTELHSHPATKIEAQALVASLKKAGIRAKLNVPEGAMWSRMVREKKVRGLGRHPGPWWVGRAHPASAWNSHFSSKSVWSFFTLPEIDEGLAALEKLTDEKEIAAKAREISKFYRENMVRSPLWAQNVPFGVRKRVKYWAQVPGWVFMVNFEHLRLE